MYFFVIFIYFFDDKKWVVENNKLSTHAYQDFLIHFGPGCEPKKRSGMTEFPYEYQR